MSRQVLLLLVALSLALGVVHGQITAQCDLFVNTQLPVDEQQPISGTITLSQQQTGGVVTLSGVISGFFTTDLELLHGFHVHQTSDFSTSCESTGGHFNPGGFDHAAPTETERHVGDLGNIQEDQSGNVDLQIQDDVIDFTGTNNILGLAIVIHAREDDLGLGNNTDSKLTGNAGPRLACCQIVQVSSNLVNKASSLTTGVSVLYHVVFLGALAKFFRYC